MTVKNKDESKQETEAITFTREQIASAKRYRHSKDVVNVVLKENQEYTLDEVDKLIDKFMKGKVK